MSDSSPDWRQLHARFPEPLVAELERKYTAGGFSYTADELARAASTIERRFTEAEALALLENAGLWLKLRHDADLPLPDPDFPDEEPEAITRFEWLGEPSRQLGWLVFIHGMNTNGRWQELLTFDIGLWQGSGVPTFIHKYGWIVLGVVLPWRRRKFKRKLRERLIELSCAAQAKNLPGKPDIVAHSFGTWLLGHVLLDEDRPCHRPEIRVGRVILTGSILRPDFPWMKLQKAKIVGEVLNHYATKDRIVPLAHWAVWDSGPSGRRGFDHFSDQVINVEAKDFDHSQVLAERYASYSKTWRPFLTNPKGHAARNLETKNPEHRWRQAWLPLRGTVLPLVVLALSIAVLALGLLSLGPAISAAKTSVRGVIVTVALYLAYAIAGLAGLFILQSVSSWVRYLVVKIKSCFR